MQALWFANISSMMLFYPYLKASILTPVKQMLGLTAQFKTTLKGGAKGVRAGLKVCIPAAIIVFINVATIIIGAITFEAQVNAPQAISMCWIVFNTIPHLALILHAIFGPGGFMVAFCRAGMFITAAAGALALVLMWLLWPKEASFVEPLNNSVSYLAVCRRRVDSVFHAHLTVLALVCGCTSGVSAASASHVACQAHALRRCARPCAFNASMSLLHLTFVEAKGC